MEDNKIIKIYLSSPYTLYRALATDEQIEDFIQYRYEQVSEVTVKIFERLPFIIPFSPIAYTHPLHTKFGACNVDWLRKDYYFLKDCDWLVELHLDLWEESEGMKQEREWAEELKMPVLSVKPNNVIGILEYNYGRYLEYGGI